MLMQDPITQSVANAIGMTPQECESQPKKAARKAAAILRANGYAKKYCHSAWQRGMRWYYNGSDVPERNLCATSLLGIAMIDGRITTA
jgi:hypothetical protein